MSWWQQELNKKKSYLRKINQLRNNYLDLLETNEILKSAKEAYNKENSIPTPTPKTTNTYAPPPPQTETTEIAPYIGNPDKIDSSTNNEKSADISEEFECEKENTLENVPETLKPWIKKTYRIANLRFHPDKCKNSPPWFKDWLNAYHKNDWIQYLLFLEEIPEIIEEYPPPENEFETWIVSFLCVCFQLMASIKKEPVYQWWQDKSSTSLTQK